MDGFYHQDERDRAANDGCLGCAAVALILLIGCVVVLLSGCGTVGAFLAP